MVGRFGYVKSLVKDKELKNEDFRGLNFVVADVTPEAARYMNNLHKDDLFTDRRQSFGHKPSDVQSINTTKRNDQIKGCKKSFKHSIGDSPRHVEAKNQKR